MNEELVQAELRLRLEDARARGWLFDLAVWQLLCGEPDAGLATLRTRPPARDGRPEVSLVAGDWERAADEARLALGEATNRLVPGYRPYIQTQYALIAGLPDEAAAHLHELRDYVAVHARLRSGHPAAVADLAAGLAERVAEQARAGLDALLAWHLRRARSRSEIFNSARGVVSLEAIAALLLAHRLGLEVAVNGRFRHASVPLLALHLTEHEGRPLPRGQALTLETDLVAGAWLRKHGLELADEPPAAKRRPAGQRSRRLPSRGSAEAARAALRDRLAAGGSPWQLASWALMLGDAESARRHLAASAAHAAEQWQPTSRRSRLLRRSEVPVNQNAVREHFALALVVGDERGLSRASEALDAWEATAAVDPSAHASGYLDLIRHVLAPRREQPNRTDAERVLGPLPSVRVACTGLVERDAGLLNHGLRSTLREHAATLERRSSPPPPVCEVAVHLAVAATRVGLAVELDDDSRWYDVPVMLPGREVARLPCDLLGVAIWRTGLNFS